SRRPTSSTRWPRNIPIGRLRTAERPPLAAIGCRGCRRGPPGPVRWKRPNRAKTCARRAVHQQRWAIAMSLINLSLKHGRTADEARNSLEQAVGDVQGMFGALIQRAEWSGDRNKVRLDGAGFWVEMSVDDQHVHATGDIPFLAGLLGGPLGGGLKKVLEDRFQNKLPSPGKAS